MDDDLQEKLRELDELRAYKRRHEARRRRWSREMKAFVLSVVLITVASGSIAALGLFQHTLTYTSAAKLTTPCSAPADLITTTMMSFSCGLNPALTVTGSSGTVSYSALAFSPSQPSQITDFYIVDAAVNPQGTCASTTQTGQEPIGPLSLTGGTVTIGTTAGSFRTSHNYDYCFDLSGIPSSFTASISWSQ